MHPQAMLPKDRQAQNAVLPNMFSHPCKARSTSAHSGQASTFVCVQAAKL